MKQEIPLYILLWLLTLLFPHQDLLSSRGHEEVMQERGYQLRDSTARWSIFDFQLHSSELHKVHSVITTVVNNKST